MSKVLFAIDPSTKCTGFAIFIDGILQDAGSHSANEQLGRRERQNYLAETLLKYSPTLIDVIVSEEPMVQGRNGLALHKLLGAFEYAFKDHEINYVHPSTVKKMMGSGKLDKFEVALAAGRLVKTDREQEIIAELISREDFDATDAVAIGLSWMELNK